ncbi:MAG TPA: hypothetical protein VJ788_07010 [Gemmatimonadota bacterium]|nr:hypothetical protein [Gemmatimonadota bacterium]
MLAASGALGCVASLTAEAGRALEAGGDPAPLVVELTALHDAIDRTKRIFHVTLVEGNRRFQGEGALSYRSRPLAARGDVFGPQATPVLRFALFGDSLTVILPGEGEVLRGRLGDPRFAELTGERALVTPEVLGALLGAYDVRRLLERSDRTAATAHDDRRTLYIWEAGALHALTVRAGRLVEYRQATGGELAYRVEFEEFAPVDGRESPRRVVVRDFARDRWLVLEVSREHEEVEDAVFQPLP